MCWSLGGTIVHEIWCCMRTLCAFSETILYEIRSGMCV